MCNTVARSTSLYQDGSIRVEKSRKLLESTWSERSFQVRRIWDLASSLVDAEPNQWNCWPIGGNRYHRATVESRITQSMAHTIGGRTLLLAT